MSAELVWTQQAREDLLDLYTLIALEQPQAADRYYARIFDKARTLAMFPRSGMHRPDIRPGLRILVETPYLLLHRIAPEDDDSPIVSVEIVRVVDGRRDLAGLV